MAELGTLQNLFEDELRDVYDAEKQILKALPKMIKAATDESLRTVLDAHRQETLSQVDRLEQAFKSLELRPRGKHCVGMEGILKEGAELIEEDGDAMVLDAAYVAAAQRVEHYEITAYGSLMAWAKVLGYGEALALLAQNEREEKAADAKLSKLAESKLNAAAGAAGQDALPDAGKKKRSGGTKRVA
jgi:ferritin-like metal-binding protein YciE